MKTSKIRTVLSAVLLALQVAAEGVAAAFVLRLNVLPNQYLLLMLAAFILLTALTAGLLFLHGNKPVGLVRQIVGWILAILIAIACLLVGKVAFDAYRTLHEVTKPVEQTSVYNMYILVRADDPAQTVADVADYPFGIIADYDEEHTQQAILLTQEETGKTLRVTPYEMISGLADAILEKQVDAAFINGAALVLLTEDAAYEDFLEKVRILQTIPLVQLEEIEETTEPSTVPVESITNTPFVVYISGSDTRNKKLRISRSDVNILAVVNPVTKQVLLVNTPRDYYVANPAGKGKKDKLTHCGLYGPECSMGALEILYGIKVDYYAQVNFTGLETLVDAIGGITVNSPQAFRCGGYRDIQIVKGENHLNGREALEFARERYNVKGGDNGRGKNQMRVITAIIQKLTTGTTAISNYSSILKSMEGMFKTSVSMDDVSALVKMQLDDMATWNVQSFAATGTGGREKNYSSPGHKAYVMYPNKASVAHASALMERVLAGEILTAEDMVVPK